MPTIDDVVERVDLWRGRDVEVAKLSGGLTNTNYVVRAGGERAQQLKHFLADERWRARGR